MNDKLNDVGKKPQWEWTSAKISVCAHRSMLSHHILSNLSHKQYNYVTEKKMGYRIDHNTGYNFVENSNIMTEASEG